VAEVRQPGGDVSLLVLGQAARPSREYGAVNVNESTALDRMNGMRDTVLNQEQ
jgi:hypothetical protein